MFPALRPGDQLTIEPISSVSLQLGDLVAFIGPDGRLCTHRVVGFDAGHPVTRGDAAPAPDGPLAPHQLVGIVSRVQRAARSFAPPRIPPLWERAIAALCRRSDLFHRFVLRLWALRRKLG